MRTKARKSEYQRAFQGPDKEYCKNLHEEMHAYRSQRRQLEFAHERVKWDSSDSSSASGNSSECASPSPEEQDEQTMEVTVTENTPVNMVEKVDGGEENGNESDDTEVGETDEQESPKPESFGRKSTEPNREESNEETPEKPPFVPYGWADKELETARKMTHNIRANKDYVYPSALKRQRLVKNEKTRQEEARAESRASVAAALQTKQKALLNDVWMTEYQRCFSRTSVRPASASDVSHRQKKRRSSTRPKMKRPKTR